MRSVACLGRGKRKKQEVDYSLFLDERVSENDERLAEQMQRESEYLDSIRRSTETSAYVSKTFPSKERQIYPNKFLKIKDNLFCL